MGTISERIALCEVRIADLLRKEAKIEKHLENVRDSIDREREHLNFLKCNLSSNHCAGKG